MVGDPRLRPPWGPALLAPQQAYQNLATTGAAIMTAQSTPPCASTAQHAPVRFYSAARPRAILQCSTPPCASTVQHAPTKQTWHGAGAASRLVFTLTCACACACTCACTCACSSSSSSSCACACTCGSGFGQRPRPSHNRCTGTDTCVRWLMAVTCSRYKFITAPLPKRFRNGRFTSETAC
jgi:hypothetical protein